MIQNLDTKHRVIRTLIGLAIIGAGVYYKHWFGFIGVIPILVAAFGYCPICNSGTCETKKAPKEHKHGPGCRH